MYGYVWVCMGMYGYVCVSIGIYGNVWECIVMYGYVWGLYGDIMVCTGINRYVWLTKPYAGCAGCRVKTNWVRVEGHIVAFGHLEDHPNLLACLETSIVPAPGIPRIGPGYENSPGADIIRNLSVTIMDVLQS